jgi:hypothetical protein
MVLDDDLMGINNLFDYGPCLSVHQIGNKVFIKEAIPEL